MAFPVAQVHQPAALAGTTNGKIPAGKLVVTPSLHRGRDVTLLVVATRAFVAMRAAAEKAGIRLEALSSYRTYDQQVALFTERYVPHYTRHTDGTVSYRVWNGQRWYHAFGPTTAVPGTSNHGRALAVDFIITSGFIDWMLGHAATYGWSWEIQSENWHLRYHAGDRIPAAVLAYERTLTTTAPQEDDDMPLFYDDPAGDHPGTYMLAGGKVAQLLDADDVTELKKASKDPGHTAKLTTRGADELRKVFIA